ncbi:MAG TPA: orotidine-5'-phosphate decarboxylase [Thermoanaerobaculia bacterium]|jgi:orotidine-5'-phosphate decarboxylase|nr:orotidine-5'-phosphate decarboxylase [Thermoanaerobaculia bacterium]
MPAPPEELSANGPASRSTSPSNDRRPLDRVAVALDTDDWQQFAAWCRLFGPRVGLLKVGLQAFVRWGARAVETAQASGRGVFLDLKLHDIPNTVAGAVAAARSLEVQLLTVHAGGAEPMLRAAVEAAGNDVAILAVTLLTHLGDEELTALDLPGGATVRVERWAELAARAGCAGVVCSPQETAALRQRLPRPFLLVTPGVRPAGSTPGDQRRVATPAAALRDGADWLVVGRPLTGAPDPAAALAALEEELAGPAG